MILINLDDFTDFLVNSRPQIRLTDLNTIPMLPPRTSAQDLRYTVWHGGLLPWLIVWFRNLYLTILGPPTQMCEKQYTLCVGFQPLRIPGGNHMLVKVSNQVSTKKGDTIDIFLNKPLQLKCTFIIKHQIVFPPKAQVLIILNNTAGH